MSGGRIHAQRGTTLLILLIESFERDADLLEEPQFFP